MHFAIASSAETGHGQGPVSTADAVEDGEKLALCPPSLWLCKEQQAIDKALVWDRARPAACGLHNAGNTCFLNSALQCLAHTPALAQMLVGKRYMDKAWPGSPSGMMHHLTSVLARLHQKQGGAFIPVPILKRLHVIGRQFRQGRQEDSHEFLRCLLQAADLHELRVAGVPENAPQKRDLTSLIPSIFGLHLRSQLQCPDCGFCSNKYDPGLDLSLDLPPGVTSVQDALHRFAAEERLDSENRWECHKCKRKVRALKHMCVRYPPQCLVVHLKRFRFGGLMGGGRRGRGPRGAHNRGGFHKNKGKMRMGKKGGGMGGKMRMFGMLGGLGSLGGGKVSRHVSFPEELDLSPALAKEALQEGQPTSYRLHGVLVHSGSSQHSGHYFAYVRTPAGGWSLQDDSSSSTVAARHVLQQQAYILFYSRDPESNPPGPPLLAQALRRRDAALSSPQSSSAPGSRSEAAVTAQGIPLLPLPQAGARSSSSGFGSLSADDAKLGDLGTLGHEDLAAVEADFVADLADTWSGRAGGALFAGAKEQPAWQGAASQGFRAHGAAGGSQRALGSAEPASTASSPSTASDDASSVSSASLSSSSSYEDESIESSSSVASDVSVAPFNPVMRPKPDLRRHMARPRTGRLALLSPSVSPAMLFRLRDLAVEGHVPTEQVAGVVMEFLAARHGLHGALSSSSSSSAARRRRWRVPPRPNSREQAELMGCLTLRSVDADQRLRKARRSLAIKRGREEDADAWEEEGDEGDESEGGDGEENDGPDPESSLAAASDDAEALHRLAYQRMMSEAAGVDSPKRPKRGNTVVNEDNEPRSDTGARDPPLFAAPQRYAGDEGDGEDTSSDSDESEGDDIDTALALAAGRPAFGALATDATPLDEEEEEDEEAEGDSEEDEHDDASGRRQRRRHTTEEEEAAARRATTSKTAHARVEMTGRRSKGPWQAHRVSTVKASTWSDGSDSDQDGGQGFAAPRRASSSAGFTQGGRRGVHAVAAFDRFRGMSPSERRKAMERERFEAALDEGRLKKIRTKPTAEEDETRRRVGSQFQKRQEALARQGAGRVKGTADAASGRKKRKGAARNH